jgi:hypothetical protein
VEDGIVNLCGGCAVRIAYSTNDAMDQPKQPLALADVAAILDVLGRAPDPQAAFRVFDHVVQRVLEHKLLTIMRHVAATAEVERIYSSNPRAYPVGGRKQKQGTPWGEQVPVPRTRSSHDLCGNCGCELRVQKRH